MKRSTFLKSLAIGAAGLMVAPLRTLGGVDEPWPTSFYDQIMWVYKRYNKDGSLLFTLNSGVKEELRLMSDRFFLRTFDPPLNRIFESDIQGKCRDIHASIMQEYGREWDHTLPEGKTERMHWIYEKYQQDGYVTGIAPMRDGVFPSTKEGDYIPFEMGMTDDGLGFNLIYDHWNPESARKFNMDLFKRGGGEKAPVFLKLYGVFMATFGYPDEIPEKDKQLYKIK